jgi:hypothetical protein
MVGSAGIIQVEFCADILNFEAALDLFDVPESAIATVLTVLVLFTGFAVRTIETQDETTPTTSGLSVQVALSTTPGYIIATVLALKVEQQMAFGLFDLPEPTLAIFTASILDKTVAQVLGARSVKELCSGLVIDSHDVAVCKHTIFHFWNIVNLGD